MNNEKKPLLAPPIDSASRGKSSKKGAIAPQAPLLSSTSSSHRRLSSVEAPNRFLKVFGFRDKNEASLVLCLCLCGGLANIVFVCGRNIGPALFVKEVGPKALPRAMLVSGLTILIATPKYASFAKKRSATNVNSGLLIRGAAILMVLYLALRFHLSVYLILYVCEDLTTLLIVMQNGAVAQELFTATEARRLLGLVQLGSTLGAIVAGLFVGPLARLIGVNGIILAQIAVLILSLVPNAATARRARLYRSGPDTLGLNIHKQPESSDLTRPSSRTSSLKEHTQLQNLSHHHQQASGEQQQNHTTKRWYREPLIMTLALYTALVIIVKTTVEFEYNVIVSKESTAVEMVALTGRLYSTAGVCAFFLNVGGSRVLLSRFGLAAAAYAFPGGLLLAASAIVFDHASLRSAFFARVLDLTTRWSLNNNFKSVVWIAVDRSMARAARPHVEATTKKAAAAAAALALGVAVNYGHARVTQLNWLVLAGCLALLLIGSVLRRLYVAEMTKRIDRRRVPLARPEALLSYLTADTALQQNKQGVDADPLRSLVTKGGDDQDMSDEVEDTNLPKEDVLLCGDDDCGPQMAQWTAGDDDAFSAAEGRASIVSRLFTRFAASGPSVRLYLLRQIGSSPLLGEADLEHLFLQFDQWEPAIQLSSLREVIAKGRGISGTTTLVESSHSKRGSIMQAVATPSGWEENLLERIGTSQKYHPAVVAAAAMAAAQRGMAEAEPWLERLLTAKEPAPRCAAACALLMLAWGLGGPLTLASAEVLQAALATGTIEKTPRLVRVADGTSLRRYIPSNYEEQAPSLEQIESQERAAEEDWAIAIENGQEGLALISAARLTSLRLTRRKLASGVSPLVARDADDSGLTEDEDPSPKDNIEMRQHSNHPTETLAALRALQHFSNKLTLDTGSWLELCAHRDSIIRSAVLALPLPNVVRSGQRRKQLLNRIADQSGGRETAQAAAEALSRLVEQFPTLRPLAFDALFVRLERTSSPFPLAFENSSEDKESLDVVCLLDALRAITRPSDASNVSEAIHGMSAKATDENEGFLLDFIFELLDDNKACPSQLENGVLQRARDVRQARDALRFVMRPKQLAFKAEKENLSKAAALLKGYPVAAGDERISAYSIASELSALANAYFTERVFGARQQLLARCILLGRARADGCSVRARDAWKSLRSRDPRLASAVMELLDDVLPAHLKSVVLPLLDPVSDYDMRSNASLTAVTDFLKSGGDRLGINLGHVLSLFLGDNDEDLVDENNSLAAVNYLRRTRIFGGSLVGQHLQPLAEYACEWRKITNHGESICRPGETYLVARGACILHRDEDVEQWLEEGAVVQEFHALGQVANWPLPLARATAVIAHETPDLLLLVVDAKRLAKLMRSISPKFSFSLLKSLVNTLPKPNQRGGRALSVNSNDNALFSTTQATEHVAPVETDKNPSQLCCSTFTPLEKFLVLRDAKMLRFVPDAYLATLADVAEIIVYPPRSVIAKISTPTDSTLYCLADGSVELLWGRDVAVSLNQPGASFGNTALLSDTSWPYSVRSGPNGASIFALRRYRVHDALRGRRDLAAAVAEGFLKTLGRRALQHVSIEEGLDTVEGVVSPRISPPNRMKQETTPPTINKPSSKRSSSSSPSLAVNIPNRSNRFASYDSHPMPPSITTALRVDFVTTIASTPPEHREGNSAGENFVPLHRARSFEHLGGAHAVSPTTRHLLQHHSYYATTTGTGTTHSSSRRRFLDEDTFTPPTPSEQEEKKPFLALPTL